jgi:hypothetical protein
MHRRHRTWALSGLLLGVVVALLAFRCGRHSTIPGSTETTGAEIPAGVPHDADARLTQPR